MVLALQYALLLTVLHVIDAQTGGGQQQAGGVQCMQMFDQQLSPKCFDPRGLNFQGVLFLITRNVTGRLPEGETVQSYTQKVCRRSEVDAVIPCVLQLKSQYTNATCAADEVAMIDTSATQLTIIIDQMCMQPCERRAVQSMSQCFAPAQLSPDKWLNTTMTADKFSIMGNTSAELSRFCSSRAQLFPCLGQVEQVCPSALPRLREMGIDIGAMELASRIVCERTETYLAAARCFFQQNPAVGACAQAMEARLADVVRGRFISGQVPPSEFLKKLCGVKLNLITCELEAFTQTCSSKHTAFRRMVECTIIPAYCRQIPEYQAGIQRLCPKDALVPTVRPTMPTPRPGVPTTKGTNVPTRQLTANGGASVFKNIGVVIAFVLLLTV